MFNDDLGQGEGKVSRHHSYMAMVTILGEDLFASVAGTGMHTLP